MDKPHKSKFLSNQQICLMMLVCQCAGLSATQAMPEVSFKVGVLGSIFSYMAGIIFLGVPILYVEMVIGQFTSQDCIDVWSIRPCLRHVGYAMIFFQIFLIMHDHVHITFMFHYFLLSFEKVLPFYQCGPWSDRSCNILMRNYTLNEDCVYNKMQTNYCLHLDQTFPEHQFWVFKVLRYSPAHTLNIAWRVTLPSGVICLLIYFSCFKRQRSLRYVICMITFYPIIGSFIQLMGMMTQKGIATKFGEAFDIHLTRFWKNSRVTFMLLQSMHCLTVGSGTIINLVGKASFRAPCYSNAVISTAVTSTFIVLIVASTAMMACPFLYEYNLPVEMLTNSNHTLVFEKTPNLMGHFDHKRIWLTLNFSIHVIAGLRKMIIMMYTIQEVFANRFAVIAKYPELFSIVLCSTLFGLTLPLLSYEGLSIVAVSLKRYIYLVSVFFVVMEYIVFVLWYGLNKFSEDVHFMQGVPPGAFMKTLWVLSVGVYIFIFIYELTFVKKTFSLSFMYRSSTISFSVLIGTILYIVLPLVVMLSVAAIKKRFMECVSLNPKWGPQKEILQRSRAMFTGQAMTKEYLYRQYHLQAGIDARKRWNNLQSDDVSSEL